MAHVGRLYPLHFRRDLATDVFDNKKAFGKRYDVGAAFIGGTVGGPLTGMRIRVNPVDERTFNGAKWQSTYVPVSGHLIRYVIECSLSKGFPTNIVRVKVEDLSLGNLVEANALRSKNAGYGLIEAKQLYSGPTHPTLLSTDGPNILFQLFVVGW